MRAIPIFGLLLLATACAPQTGPQPTLRADLILDADRTINADAWTVLQLQEIYDAVGEQNTEDYELKLAIIRGDRDESFVIVGCVEAVPEVAVVAIYTAETADLSLGARLQVTIKGDKRPNLSLFDTIDGAVAAIIDTRLAVGRNVLAALLDSAKPVAVQIAENPAVRFKPGDEVVKTMFTECRDAAPSLGA